jgi:hypothetical protein
MVENEDGGQQPQEETVGVIRRKEAIGLNADGLT